MESQIKKLEGWAEKNENQISKSYQDYAVSGKKDDRKGILELLADAKQGKFTRVGVVELSRIGRSIKFIYEAIEELQKYNVKVVLVSTGTEIDSTKLEGRALLGGLALAADIEWMLIQERNARGRQAIKDKNIKVGRKEKDVSMEAIKALREKGMSVREVAKELKVSAPTILRRLGVESIEKTCPFCKATVKTRSTTIFIRCTACGKTFQQD